jgi:DNA-directed RNA polymerase beta subunit
MIKYFEGIEQALFFDNIFEELIKKDNMEEEITKISKCIFDLYNNRNTINPEKEVVKQYIAKYESCMQKQNNIANNTIYRQPQIEINESPSVVIHQQVPTPAPAPKLTPVPEPGPAPAPKLTPIINQASIDIQNKIELFKKQFPIGSLVKVIKFNKVLTSIKNNYFKNDGIFYARVLEEAKLIDNIPKILIGFKHRQNKKNTETTYHVNADSIQLLNENEIKNIKTLYNSIQITLPKTQLALLTMLSLE